MNERIEQLRARLREDPSSRLFFQLGELLRKEGEIEEAVGILRGGLEVYPRYVAAWVSLGRALFESASYDESEAAFAKALELDPENPIASRMTGEIAISRQDWLSAVRSLKLARVFSPPDDELEEKISFVEERLAEQGQLEEPRASAPAAPPAAPGATSEEQEAATEVLPVVPPPAAVREEEAPAPAAPFGAAPELTPEVFSLSAEDPFADSGPGGDTGVFDLGDDVFGAVPEAAGPVELPADEEPAAAGPESTEPVAFVPSTLDESESSLEDDEIEGADTVPGMDLSAEVAAAEEEPGQSVAEADAEPEVNDAATPLAAELQEVEEIPLPAEEYEPAESAEVDLAGLEEDDENEAPLPTMTLARLAFEQEDFELAERTLHALLEQDPGHEGAAAMLRQLQEPEQDQAAEVAAPSLSARKVLALQSWLDRLKLAAGEQRA